MRINWLGWPAAIVLGLLLLIGGPSAQPVANTPAPTLEAVPGARLLYFDEPAGLSTFHKTSVYRAWRDPKAFYLLPTGLEDTATKLSIQYRRTRGKLTGNAVLVVEPALEPQEFKSIVAELMKSAPNSQFMVAEPSGSDWEVLGFGLDASVTPIFTSNPLLSTTSVSIPLPEQILKTLLHEGAELADVIVVRHKFGVRGVELTADLQPRVTTRWFNRGVSVRGSCASNPERYLNIDTGTVGCLFKLHHSSGDVKEAQRALRALNLYRGPIDGFIGPLTKASIRQYQRSKGVANDGLLSNQLLVSLSTP